MQPGQEGDDRLSFFEAIFDYRERGLARHVFSEPIQLLNGEWADEATMFFATWLDLHKDEANPPEVMYYEAQLSFASARQPCKLKFRWLLDELGATQLLKIIDDDSIQSYCKASEIDDLRGRFWNAESSINFLDHLLVHFTIPLGTEIIEQDTPEFAAYQMDNDSSFTMPGKPRRP